MTSTYSAALTQDVHRQAVAHLVRRDGQEDLCFALWYPSHGATRTTALIERLILPQQGDRSVHGNVTFTAQYFQRALGEAMAANAGLAFMHSHPFPGWQGMSKDDVKAEQSCSAAVRGATALPFVGLTIGNDGAWSARFWKKVAPNTYSRHWCTHVRVVGDGLTLTYADGLILKPRFREELTRTVSAWGEAKQADLARLHVGIVGVGSVGGIVAESLARMGVQRITLIDFDRFENLNLDRSLHARREDARVRASKVSVVSSALQENATAADFVVTPIDRSIVEDEGFRAALDCDVLFSCVDRPWARSALNFCAYAHLIPVIDGGIRVDVSKHGTLIAADWRAHVVGPGRQCLECMGQYDASLVAMERDGYLDSPEYIRGLPKDHALRKNENVFAFSLSTAGFQVLQMLSMVISPLGMSNIGEQLYHFVPGVLDVPAFRRCEANCLFPGWIARGERAGISVTGRHKVAEDARNPSPQ